MALDVACLIGGSIVSFSELRVAIALIPDEYPSEVLTIFDPPPCGRGISSDIDDLCIRVEVLGTGSSTTTGRNRRAAEVAATAAAGAGKSGPLLARLRNLRAPIVPSTNRAAAAADLEASRKLLYAEATELATAQRQLEAAQRECNTTYGLTPVGVKPSRRGDVRRRGGAISELFGANMPIYDTPVQNLRVAEAAAAELDHLEGEAQQQQQQWVRALVATTNRLQD